jgi:kinesin family protein 2/24
MVLRDSFLASEKVKIVMLTCINPGNSSANHTLNSLRYAERLKTNVNQGQGQGSSGGTRKNQEQINEELRIFMEKHGKMLDIDERSDLDSGSAHTP